MPSNPPSLDGTDIREEFNCACPRRDAGDCIDFRSGYDMRFLLAAPGDREYNEPSSGEMCECACHDDSYEPGYDDESSGAKR